MPGLLRLHDSLINLLSDYLPLYASLTSLDEPERYYGLGPIPQGAHVIYFEVEFGKYEKRLKYFHRNLARRGAKTPFVDECNGVQDLFVPLRGPRHVDAWVVLGGFHSQLPSRSTLWQQWCRLRGAPGPDDARDFVLYAFAQLETPLLDKASLKVLGKVLTQAGQALLGRASATQAEQSLAKAKRELLGQGLPWRMWHYAAARRDRFHRGPYQGSDLASWDAVEFRLKRGPDSAVALVPRQASIDPVEALQRAVALQWACFEYCRQHEGLVAGRLEGEGALILCAGQASSTRALASEAAASLSRKLGFDLVTAWGSQPMKPQELEFVIRDVEAALRLALAQGESLVQAKLVGHAEPMAGEHRLHASAEKLARMASEGRWSAYRLARVELAELALGLSGGRRDILGAQLRWTQLPLIQLWSRRQGWDGAAQNRAAQEAALYIEAATASELLRKHQAWCEEMLLRLSQPAGGELAQRLNQAAGRLREHPGEVASLQALASESGISLHHFSRLFKASSGLGFAKARQAARLERACRLLVETDLSIAALAADCGFKNFSHFSKLFRLSQGQSPSAYRKKRTLITQ